MNDEELIHQTTVGPWGVDTFVSPETVLWHGDGETEINRKIDSGELLHFQVHVEVSLAGIALGHDFLGSCCYRKYEDFLGGDYHRDMVRTAISDAKDKLRVLVNRLVSTGLAELPDGAE